jgi:hypothetical protein
MVNARGLTRLGMLAVGLGIGATVASTPGIASADSLDFQISIDGYDLLPTADNSATATSGMGDFAIAFGAGATATATGGTGDFAMADGSGSSERRLVGGPSRAVLVARLDGCHSCGGVRPAKALEIHTTGGKQTVDAAFEVT